MIRKTLVATVAIAVSALFVTAVLADEKSKDRGAPVLKCEQVQKTTCTQTTPNGPATNCTTKTVTVCTTVGGTGSIQLGGLPRPMTGLVGSQTFATAL